MPLDREYFDSISIELVKKKYYNANKVNAVFDEIRDQAIALSEENKALKKQLEGLNSKKAEIGEAVMSAQSLYKDIVDKANASAAGIIKEAQDKRDQMLAEDSHWQEYAVKRVGACIAKLREQQQKTIELINSEWQSFLCDLDGKPGEAEETYPDIGNVLETIGREIDSINSKTE